MDKIEKFLRTRPAADRAALYSILADVRALNLAKYDIKPLRGYKDLYRLRKGKIRIVFYRGKQKGLVIELAFRKDAYKNL